MNNTWTWTSTARAAVLLALSTVGLHAAASPSRWPVVTPPAGYVEECGACHTAYVPGLLPAPSWQRLMSSLDRHFGVDAALDAATTRRLSDWLQAHAATSPRWRQPPPEDRITRSAAFVRKHREIPPAVWSHPQVGRPSQCAACHPGASRGDFDDDRLRLPPGSGAGVWRHGRD